MERRASLRERQFGVREEAILEVAAELLAERGYDGTSMADVAAGVGVSKKTLYEHFSSKEEMAVSVVAGAMRRAGERVAGVDPALPAIARLRLALRQAIEVRAGLGPTRFALPPAVARHPDYRLEIGRLIGALAALVDEAKEDGEVDPGLPTLLISRVLFYGVLDADFTGLSETEHGTRANLADALVTILIDGVRMRNA